MPLNSGAFIELCFTSASKLASHDSSETMKTSYFFPIVITQGQEIKSKAGSFCNTFNTLGIYVDVCKIFLYCETCHTYRVLYKAYIYNSKNIYKVNIHVITTHIKMQNTSCPQPHCMLFPPFPLNKQLFLFFFFL